MALANHKMLVSKELFAEITDAIRSFSQETSRFETLNTTTACATERFLQEEPALDRLQQFSSVPVEGDIVVYLVTKDDNAEEFRKARRRVAQMLEEPESTIRTLSVLVQWLRTG